MHKEKHFCLRNFFNETYGAAKEGVEVLRTKFLK